MRRISGAFNTMQSLKLKAYNRRGMDLNKDDKEYDDRKERKL